MIQIDGSQGEGGGQIVRSSLALALVTGRGMAIEKLRAGRAKPGLMRQHLTAVRAAAEISRAEVTGDVIGSSSLTFRPGPVIPGEYQFRVGTAGSATLVLQTVLPPLLTAAGPSTLILEGGTHNPWAPPFDFLSRAYFPFINRMGPRVSGTLERAGFYPAGGGRFVVEIEPVRQLKPFSVLERGPLRQQSGRVIFANLPDHIAQREVEALQRLTGWDPACFTVEKIDGMGPGNVVVLELEYEQVTEIFTGFGEQGIRAEEVSRRAIDAMRKYLVADVPVGPYLADQLLLLLGIMAWQTGKKGEFRSVPLTRHSSTQVDILGQYLGVISTVTPDENSKNVTVTVHLDR
jgi:RNA 3'-terminal phosphate cyclase (ATP)